MTPKKHKTGKWKEKKPPLSFVTLVDGAASWNIGARVPFYWYINAYQKCSRSVQEMAFSVQRFDEAEI